METEMDMYTAVAIAEGIQEADDEETLAALDMKGPLRSCAGGRLCPSDWTGCPHAVTHQKAGERVNEAAV